MEKEYEILTEKVMKGTQRAIDKLILEAERTGKKLVVSEKKNITENRKDF